jgi:hypothetical protein
MATNTIAQHQCHPTLLRDSAAHTEEVDIGRILRGFDAFQRKAFVQHSSGSGIVVLLQTATIEMDRRRANGRRRPHW